MNKVTLIGNIIRDLELKNYEGGCYTRFTLAINDFNRKARQLEPVFINVVAFGKKAETLSKYISKGKKLAIEGRLNNSSYVTKEGVKRYSTEVILEDFDFVDRKKENKENVV